MNNKTRYEEQPLGYWEKDSYMQAVVETINPQTVEQMIEKVETVEGVKVIASREISEEAPGGIRLTYKGETYDLFYYPSNFTFYEMYARGPFFPTEEEKVKLQSANLAITFCMKFVGSPKTSFHLQLKLIYALVPNLICLIDESAEKLLPRNWLKIVTASKATPSADDLYTIQAVTNEEGNVWLHTHGLARCGIPELDILNTSRENYNVHYNLLTSYASYLLDDVSKDPSYLPIHLGFLKESIPLIVTSISWTIGINEYDNLSLGGFEDRQEEHNSKRNVIFIYNSKQEEETHTLTKLNDYNHYWSENPLFFISNDETEIRSIIAKERFHYLKELADDPSNEILLKIALPIPNSTQREHIYFRLVTFKGDKFEAVLLQDSYSDIPMKPGDSAIFSLSDVSDWTVYTSEGTISPSRVYLLEK